ncbi:MAG: acetoacetate decarboxylase family protein [Chloroflexi bacterium]|nr:acetoacetate decarboxylase family protein [Chloroflexota bacterium]MDA1298432.1 acetoacetate decarboxylase family protein [Chloroflexota bacterium]
MSPERRQDMYRMPTVFGPATGPRRGPDGRIFDCIDNPKSIHIAVSFLSNADQLNSLLPDRFELSGEPIVTVSGGYMKEIEWLAGRGYNTLGVSFPATFKGERDTATGQLLTVLWENLTDPIITGREELGFAKIYCALPEPEITPSTASASANWLGFEFMKMELTGLAEGSDNAPPAFANSDGTLHYKYMPRTGEWGTADSEYAVITPAAGSNARVLERRSGNGTVTWNRARWEDLPTQYNIVNGIADLEVREWLGATVTKTIGGKDLSDQRILR